MGHSIEQLLREAKQDAPPMRDTVDDIVACGRRRQTRRRYGWSGAAAAGATLAVAAAITLPQVALGRHPTGHTRPTASPTPARTTESFNYTFDGYTVGEFEVTAPFLVTPGYQQAYVHRDGDPPAQDPDGSVSPVPNYSALLTVYHPGVYEPTLSQHAQPVTVNGRPGFYGPDIRFNFPNNGPRAVLAWQYADDAWATVSQLTVDDIIPAVGLGGVHATVAYSEAELMSIAEAFTGAPARGATLAFKMNWTPPGYLATQVAGTVDGSRITPYLISGAVLVTTQPSYTHLTQPVDLYDSGGGPAVNVRVYPMSGPVQWPRQPVRPGDPPDCFTANACYIAIGGGYVVDAWVLGGDLPVAVLKHILESLTFATMSDPATWFPVADAVPGGAR